MQTSDPDLDLAHMRRLTRKVRSFVARARWRAAMQARSCRVQLALLTFAHASGVIGLSRIKTPAGWLIGPDQEAPIATLVTACPARSLDDLAEPLLVRVHRAEALDLDVLRALETDRVIRLEIEEYPQ
jgi:hypothetical protein